MRRARLGCLISILYTVLALDDHAPHAASVFPSGQISVESDPHHGSAALAVPGDLHPEGEPRYHSMTVRSEKVVTTSGRYRSLSKERRSNEALSPGQPATLTEHSQAPPAPGPPSPPPPRQAAAAPAPAPARTVPVASQRAPVAAPSLPSSAKHRMEKDTLYLILISSSCLGLVVVWRQAKVLVKKRSPADLTAEVMKQANRRKQSWAARRWTAGGASSAPPPAAASSSFSAEASQVDTAMAKASVGPRPSLGATPAFEAEAPHSEADAAGGGARRSLTSATGS